MNIESIHQAATDIVDKIVLDVGAAGYPAKSLYCIRLACDEALANAIHHGNRDNPTKTISVNYSVTEQEVWISIEDEGEGFPVD